MLVTVKSISMVLESEHCRIYTKVIPKPNKASD